MYKQVSKKEFEQTVRSENLTVVKFKKEWNGACQILEPVYSDLSKMYAGMAGFYAVDIESERELEITYGITEVPTILLFKRGQMIDHAVGLTSKNELIEKIEAALKN